MNNQKFNEFITIAKKLNDLKIIPLLMGSVGLEVLTNRSWDAKDVDIHVPGDPRGWEVPPEQSIHSWSDIVSMMEVMSYRLVDLHEHEFSKDGMSVEFGIMDTLPAFAGIALEDLEIHKKEDVSYYLLNHSQYLRVYEASSQDSYRADKNNHKDLAKIDFLTEAVR
ncbi:phosphoribosylanthranilate isomerase [Priestia koreensis]|uniref:phosphoribosylanthranilate isomerase n=1 Tax=Priestia koreensis TaxID=284581 RepID=UPI001F5AF65B|nr:phosphoribosylanthranilate isomerase [Priestia koreensis]UNL86948.1 phosphoribosylanthranilate isomerase [Priestia koreensis]